MCFVLLNMTDERLLTEVDLIDLYFAEHFVYRLIKHNFREINGKIYYDVTVCFSKK